MGSDLGDRMKHNYEMRGRHYLLRRMPVIIRVDGRAFHSLLRNANKPFDRIFIQTMAGAAEHMCLNMQGCKCGYVQSDEASFLLTDYDTLQTDAWFGYVQNKVESVAASMMTSEFERSLEIFTYYAEYLEGAGCEWAEGNLGALFDARAFNIPREEVVNYFLWRMKDWERNSVSMYCRAFFSDKEMHGKGRADQHEMLNSIGKNWATDMGEQERNGTWVFPDRTRMDILPTYESVNAVVRPLVWCDTGDADA